MVLSIITRSDSIRKTINADYIMTRINPTKFEAAVHRADGGQRFKNHREANLALILHPALSKN